MRRVVALFLPTFPTDQVRRRNGGAPAHELPMVTAIQESNRRVLASVDDAARKLKLARHDGCACADAGAGPYR